MAATSANGGQLDAGMHPAYEGLSAMPFYDEFDLSTVDVLLISQYVSAFCFVFSVDWWEELGASLESGDGAQSTLCSPPCISVSMEYYLHSPSDPVMCLPWPNACT